jgi:hypothetical protein
MLMGDDALEWIAHMAGVSKPRARAVPQITREIELENRMEKMAQRLGRPQCRIVDSCWSITSLVSATPNPHDGAAMGSFIA